MANSLEDKKWKDSVEVAKHLATGESDVDGEEDIDDTEGALKGYFQKFKDKRA